MGNKIGDINLPVKGSNFMYDSKTNKCEDEISSLKDGYYCTYVIMEQYREERGDPKLCYADLSKQERVEFDKRVEDFKRLNPLFCKFHSIGLQKDYYENGGTFKTINEKRLEDWEKYAEYQRKQKRATYKPRNKHD